jgi:hypothetical protein
VNFPQVNSYSEFCKDMLPCIRKLCYNNSHFLPTVNFST